MPTDAVPRNQFSPLHHKPQTSRVNQPTNVSSENRARSTASQMTKKSVEGVTQKLSSTYLESKTSISFPKPGEFDIHRAAALRFTSSNHSIERDINRTEYMIGKLGAHTSKVAPYSTFQENNPSNSTKPIKHSMASSVEGEVSILRDKKKRRTNLFSTADEWMKFNACVTTPNASSSRYRSQSTRSTTMTSRKEKQGSLGDIYDYQLDRLAMKPRDRHRHYFPRSLSSEDDESLREDEDLFFSPIRYDRLMNQDKEQTNEKSTIKNDSDKLLTPVEINFDDVCEEIFSSKKTSGDEDMDEAFDDGFNDEENPFAAFARDYLKD
eukprot:scaffold11537_cov73-Cyclotella_meneghiniana.AAC.7